MLKVPCEFEECKLGQFLADALVYHYETSLCSKQGDLCTDQILGMVNSGSIRADINAGREFHIFFYIFICSSNEFIQLFIHFLEILYSDLAATMPFGNSVDTFELRGDHLKEVFERAVKDGAKTSKVPKKFDLHVSGQFCMIYCSTNYETH